MSTQPPYIGRFAPSPTGPVHFGTLLAAVGSYLQAKKNNGDWLLRMEDVDITRRVEGADTDILKTLEAFGFEWQGEVVYQSQRTGHYQQALRSLLARELVFPCSCSRRQLAGLAVYPGTCRTRTLPACEEHALRLCTDTITVRFNDAVMGVQQQALASECGDFVIKRRDGLFAYQLAVVVDDALQGVTEIVRGADLLDSTARQIYLQQKLDYPTPQYAHLPLAVDAQGKKISKSEGASRVTIRDRERLLIRALDFLGQLPPDELAGSSLDDIWRWAVMHWDIGRVPKKSRMPA